MATWPTGATTDALDGDGDNLTDARVEVLAHCTNVNSIIDCRGAANGVGSLDASGLVTESELRQVRTPVVKTADHQSVAADNGRIFIMEGAITFTVDDTIASVGTNYTIKNGNLGTSDSAVSVTVSGGSTIEGETTITLRPGDGMTIVRGTSKWYSLESLRPDNLGTTNYISRRFNYFNSQVFDGTKVWTTVVTDITEATWESVGPTGSGADYVWTALDDLPSLSGFVELSCRAFCSATSAGEISAFIAARPFGSTLGFDDREIAYAEGYALVGGTSSITTTGRRVIPIDSDGRFELYWDEDANNLQTNFRLTIAGFFS